MDLGNEKKIAITILLSLRVVVIEELERLLTYISSMKVMARCHTRLEHLCNKA